MPDVLIELDRLDEPRGKSASEPRGMGGGTRPWIAVGLVLFALLALGSAARPQAAAVRHLADMLVSSEAELILVDGEVFIIEPSKLTALDSRTAQQRWQVQTPGRYHVRKEGALLLASDGRSAMGIDPSTGQTRWQLPGNVIVAEGMVISHVNRGLSAAAGANLTVYDSAGQAVWSAPGVPLLFSVDRRRQLILTLDSSSGQFTEYRIGTGEVVSREVSPELVGASSLYAYENELMIEFAGGRSVSRGGTRSIDVIDGRLSPRPERDDCGSVWCVPSTGNTFGIDLFDKATNELVAHGAGWSMVIHTDFGLVAYGPEPSGVGGAIGFFDPATRKIQSLEGWTPVGFAMFGRVSRWHGPMFFVRPAPLKTFIAVLDGGSVRVVGSVPHEHLVQCVPATHLLACRVDPQMVRVWQLS